MSGLINIGFGNAVNTAKVVAVINPDAAPVKRLVSHAREEGRIIDATQGRRTKAVIITQEDHIILSALQPDTIAKRFSQKDAFQVVCLGQNSICLPVHPLRESRRYFVLMLTHIEPFQKLGFGSAALRVDCLGKMQMFQQG